MSTKDKILDAAEKLFGEQGFAATSIRQVIELAQVNIAAIHYHYGSKDELLEHTMRRKIGPVNEQRLALLDQFESEFGPAITVELILEALLLPPLQAQPKSGDFIKLIGRLHGDGMLPEIFKKHFSPMVTRFQTALQKALPHLPPEELAWRSQFIVAVMASTFTSPQCAQQDTCLMLNRLITFLSAGLKAPSPSKEPA